VRLLVVAAIAFAGVRLRRLRRRAMYDAKTGLLSADAWTQLARRRTRRAWHVAVLMVDVDRFKAVNDRRGHLTGDAVLASVASAMRAGLRAGDLAGRFGGDEFVVLLTDVTPREAAAIAERAVQRIRTRCPVTASAGVACAAAGSSLDALTRRADAALYRAKAAGGDCAACDDEPPSAVRVTSG
jgi:diguanylate cyclase (GGDEF)-like protein